MDENHDQSLAVQITETIPEEPEEGAAPQGIQLEGVDHYGQYLQQALQQPVIVIPPLVDNQPHVQVVDNPNLPPAVVEGGLHDHPVINPQIVEAVNIPPIEDMLDTVIAPPPFSGKPTEDPGDWLRTFSNYCTFKGYNDIQKRNLFRVLLTGPAAAGPRRMSFNVTRKLSRNYWPLHELQSSHYLLLEIRPYMRRSIV